MRLSIRIAAAVAACLFVTAASAQQKGPPQFRDDKVTFADKQKFLEEFERLERQPVRTTARALKRHVFCNECGNGTKQTCTSVIGGRVGLFMCGVKGGIRCPGGATPQPGACPAGAQVTQARFN